MGSAALYDGLRASDEAVAKALGLSEVARIARAERRLREYLLVTWKRHARDAVKIAARRAEQGETARQVAAAVRDRMRRWPKEVLPRVKKEAERVYRLARIAGWKKATGQTKASLSYDTPNMTEILKAKPRAGFKALPSFTLVDENAVDALQRHQLFWIGEHYDANIGASIAEVSSEAMIEAGEDRVLAGKLIQERLSEQMLKVATPLGFHGSATSYFEMVAANAVTTGRAVGQATSFMQAGITRYTITNPVDERTCFCENTPVLMSDGSWKGIQDIEPGMEVITREGRSRKVVQKYVKSSSHWVRVCVGVRGYFECTEDHLLAEYRGGWFRASESSGRGVDFLTWQKKPDLQPLRQKIQPHQGICPSSRVFVLLAKMSGTVYSSGARVRFLRKDFLQGKESGDCKDKLLLKRVPVQKKKRSCQRAPVSGMWSHFYPLGKDRGENCYTVLLPGMQGVPCACRSHLRNMRKDIFQMESGAESTETKEEFLLGGLQEGWDLGRGRMRRVRGGVQEVAESEQTPKNFLFSRMQVKIFFCGKGLSDVRGGFYGVPHQTESYLLFRSVCAPGLEWGGSCKYLCELRHRVYRVQKRRASLQLLFSQMQSRKKTKGLRRIGADANLREMRGEFPCKAERQRDRKEKVLLGALLSSPGLQGLCIVRSEVSGGTFGIGSEKALFFFLLQERCGTVRLRGVRGRVSAKIGDLLQTGREDRQVDCGLSSGSLHRDRSGWKILAFQSSREGTRPEENRLLAIKRLQSGPFAGTFREKKEGFPSRGGEVVRTHSVVTSVDPFQRKQRAYDLEIEDDHSYVVYPGVAVHNCTVCSHMDGKTFSVEQSADTIGGVLAAETPEDVKKAQPWHGESKASIEELHRISPKAGAGTRADSEALSKAGFNVPPFHGRCRCSIDIDVEAPYAEPVTPPWA